MCIYVGAISSSSFGLLLLLSKQIGKLTHIFEKNDLNLIKAAFRNKTKYKLKAV